MEAMIITIIITIHLCLLHLCLLFITIITITNIIHTPTMFTSTIPIIIFTINNLTHFHLILMI
ncbi:hypothetical protein BJ944DRAFT_273939 [Cunninghamella echinulata]|nr:hypothetical protein BJ944DRAFT_273939 [Cunninghamella echinulata]